MGKYIEKFKKNFKLNSAVYLKYFLPIIVVYALKLIVLLSLFLCAYIAVSQSEICLIGIIILGICIFVKNIGRSLKFKIICVLLILLSLMFALLMMIWVIMPLVITVLYYILLAYLSWIIYKKVKYSQALYLKDVIANSVVVFVYAVIFVIWDFIHLCVVSWEASSSVLFNIYNLVAISPCYILFSVFCIYDAFKKRKCLNKENRKNIV